MQHIGAVRRGPELEQRLDRLGASLSARPQLGPRPGYRARLLQLLTHALRTTRTKWSE